MRMKKDLHGDSKGCVAKAVLLLGVSIFLFSPSSHSEDQLLVSSDSTQVEPDWSLNAQIPPGGRSNPFQLVGNELVQSIHAGKIHTQIYPVEVTGILPPLRPIQNFLEADSKNPLKEFMLKLF